MWALGYTYVGFDKSGRTPTYEPVYITQGGLRYSSTRNRFEGSFLVGLELVDSPGEERELVRATALTFGGDADSISPASLEFTRTGGRPERVAVVARSPRDSVRVQIVPKFDPRGATVWLPVRPALTFERSPERMQGYGVESVTLVIDTRGTVLRDSLGVSISSDRGTLSANALRMGPAGGVVKLRSAGGLGPATVRAVASGLEDAEATIRFTWPFRFVLAALLGGVLGATYAELRRRRLSEESSAARRIAGAVLGAVLATAVYVGLGINLLSAVVSAPLVNEIAVFAFSSVGAVFGLKGLSGGTSARTGT